MSNIRHDLDPILVRNSVEKQIQRYESLRIQLKKEAQNALASYENDKAEGKHSHWGHIPEGDGYVDPMIDSWIKEEREYYSLVRIIELPDKDGDRFLLLYGESDYIGSLLSNGTGPFPTLEEASNWFLNQGR